VRASLIGEVKRVLSWGLVNDLSMVKGDAVPLLCEQSGTLR
jgi:hypothetical protein